ncbi:MAG: hypothetical protein U0992_13615 [Planctomycetaceae bacterium]
MAALCYVRSPDESEQASAMQFLDEQATIFEATCHNRSSSSWRKRTRRSRWRLDSFCQTLLGSNAFVYGLVGSG